MIAETTEMPFQKLLPKVAMKSVWDQQSASNWPNPTPTMVVTAEVITYHHRHAKNHLESYHH